MGRIDQRTEVEFDKDVTQEMGGRIMKMWIARDKNGGLFLFPEKPRLVRDHHCWYGDDWWQISQDLFPEVTFENSPMEVELKLIK